MFLRPHHFQAADRSSRQDLHRSVQWCIPFEYGVRSLSFSREAIANSQFELTRCEVRLKDGTNISLPEGLGRLDLKPALEQHDRFRICLVIPRTRLSAANLSSEAGLQRFIEQTQAIPDEMHGGNDQEISFRRVNARLAFDFQDLDGMEVLPLVQIRRTSKREGVPGLDEDYCPPLLQINCWPELARDQIRGTLDFIGQKIDLVAQQVRNRGISLSSREAGDLERIFMLQAMNEAQSSLLAMLVNQSNLQQDGIALHPFPLYVELCRIVGLFSIFRKERTVAELPRYDHDDLLPVFRRLKQEIATCLSGVAEYEYEQRYFVGSGPGMMVALEDRWLSPDWNWYVGVGTRFDPQEVRRLLAPGALNWKMGCTENVDWLFKNRAEGLVLRPVDQVPRALPPDDSWIFYEVAKSGAEWPRVLESRTLALRFNINLITNLRQLEGERKLKLRLATESVELEFALFAVPARSGLSVDP